MSDPPIHHRAVAAAIVAVTVGVLSCLTVAGVANGPAGRLPFAVDIAVAVVATLASPVVLWWPVRGTLALTALVLLSPAATPVATVGAFQVAQRRPLRVAVAVAAGGVAAHAVQGLWRPSGGISFSWWLILIVVGYGALVGWGTSVRSHRALVRELRERARRAESEQGRRVAEARMLERTRIAREMHDVLAHRLSLVATHAGALEYRPDAPPERIARAAGVVRTGVHQALDELRKVILVLRDEEREDDDMRPQPVLADLSRLVEESREAGQPIVLVDEVAEVAELPAAAGRTAYRVVQEALTNARKHAAGEPVDVLLDGRPGAGLTIDVHNPLPRGSPPVVPVPAVPGSGTGLIGLTERVRLAGGRLDHEVSRGEFRLHAWLPWPP
jgi:signal transduction histidine kinase